MVECYSALEELWDFNHCHRALGKSHLSNSTQLDQVDSSRKGDTQQTVYCEEFPVSQKLNV